MRTYKNDFPGLDRQASDRLSLDVKTDEQAIVEEIAELRRQSSVSLEAMGFLMGSDPGQLSRYLKGTCSTTLTNYIRIARALGYRSKIVLEKADDAGVNLNLLAELKLSAHKVHHRR
jgi:transcriptional regulator with XRE-family HTH domain